MLEQGGNQMNAFEDVVEMFLSMITELSYLDYTEDELFEELGLKVRMVIVKAGVFKNLTFNRNRMDFNRKISDFEATVLAHGLIVEWLSPKIFNYEILEGQLGSKNFTIFSNANRLSELRKLQQTSKVQFYELVSDYDLYQTYLADEESEVS